MSIQDYNARLENNNTNLNEILNTINNLPTLKLQDKSVIPTKEKQTIQAEDNYSGLGIVNVEAIPDSYVEPSGEKVITTNGTHDVTNYKTVVTDVHEISKYEPRALKFTNYSGSDLTYEVANVNTVNITSFDTMFSKCSNITSLDLNHWDTSNVTTVNQMFNGCSKLAYVYLSNWNTSKVTDFSRMFYNDMKLTSLDLKNWDTSSATTFEYMFFYNQILTELDLSNWTTSKVTNMGMMFYGCKALTKIDIRNFDFTKVTSYSTMFGSSASDGPANNCLIIVKDDTAKSWITSKFSRLTNVKTVAEL